MAWNLVTPACNGSRHNRMYMNERLVVSLTVGGGTSSAHYLSVKISMELLKEVRWLIGDRVQIYRDGNSDLFLIKMEQNGYMISANSSPAKNCSTKSFAGTNKVAGRAKFPSRKFAKNCKSGPIPCDNITINELGIMFVMPKEILA